MHTFLLILAAASAATAAPAGGEPARARSNLPSLIDSDDYPASAKAAREEGLVEFRLDVGANGRVADCTITRSSGSAALDSTTCRLMRNRARFTPARDPAGVPRPDSMTGRIRWILPPPPPPAAG